MILNKNIPRKIKPESTGESFIFCGENRAIAFEDPNSNVRMDEEMRFYGSFSVHLQSDGSENRMGFKIYFNGEEFRKSVVEPTGLSKKNFLKNFKKSILLFEIIFSYLKRPQPIKSSKLRMTKIKSTLKIGHRFQM